MKYLQYKLHRKFDKYKLQIPLIKVAGIALKDQFDLTYIMVYLEVDAKIINIIFQCAFGKSIIQ